jgi:hypothetical protein
MNYKIIRLDKRYAYYKQFPYLIEFHKNPSWDIGTTAGSGVLAFDRCRKWFNETWGWSQDVETRAEMVKSITRTHPFNADHLNDINPHWAWSCRYQEYRIYANDAALTMFKLRWSADASA